MNLNDGTNPLLVAFWAFVAFVILTAASLLFDAFTQDPAPSSGDGAAPLSDRESITLSRSAVRTPLIPRSGRVRTSTPEPARDHEASPGATPDAHVVAPDTAREPGSGVRPLWPGYRDLSAEPAWVQAMAECVIDHESRNVGTYAAVSPNGLWFGAYQFSVPTWQSVTGLTGVATDYSPTVQDDAFATLFARGAGAGNWPGLWSEC